MIDAALEARQARPAMTCTLGFDGGGTKTECVALDENGLVLSRAAAGPSNPLRAGFEQAAGALGEAGAEALALASLTPADVTAVCAGLAGAGRPLVVKKMLPHLQRAFPRALVHVTTDFEIALEAEAGAGPGVVLVAGTGSSAFGRNATGQTARAGGQGPWVGDEGSAYDIGRRAIAAAGRARDAGGASRLGDQILASLHCKEWDELIERIAARPDDVLPRVFPIVVEAAAGDDADAREILLGAALTLAAIARTVIRRLQLGAAEFVLVKSGGVFGRSRWLDATVDTLLREAAPPARITPLSTPAAVGAARLAQRLATAAAAQHDSRG